tara:strand:+ start:19628 stop:19789 length:162 start_codon:yes stop_codon:yes gene_type:complete
LPSAALARLEIQAILAGDAAAHAFAHARVLGAQGRVLVAQALNLAPLTQQLCR